MVRPEEQRIRAVSNYSVSAGQDVNPLFHQHALSLIFGSLQHDDKLLVGTGHFSPLIAIQPFTSLDPETWQGWAIPSKLLFKQCLKGLDWLCE